MRVVAAEISQHAADSSINVRMFVLLLKAV